MPDLVDIIFQLIFLAVYLNYIQRLVRFYRPGNDEEVEEDAVTRLVREVVYVLAFLWTVWYLMG